MRRSDSNRRPSGYEPDELPLLHSAIELYPRLGTLPNGASEWASVTGMRPASVTGSAAS